MILCRGNKAALCPVSRLWIGGALFSRKRRAGHALRLLGGRFELGTAGSYKPQGIFYTAAQE